MKLHAKFQNNFKTIHKIHEIEYFFLLKTLQLVNKVTAIKLNISINYAPELGHRMYLHKNIKVNPGHSCKFGQ